MLNVDWEIPAPPFGSNDDSNLSVALTIQITRPYTVHVHVHEIPAYPAWKPNPRRAMWRVDTEDRIIPNTLAIYDFIYCKQYTRFERLSKLLQDEGQTNFCNDDNILTKHLIEIVRKDLRHVLWAESKPTWRERLSTADGEPKIKPEKE